MKRTIFLSCLVAAFLVFVTAPTMALPGKIQIGNLKIMPGVALQGVHDNNIYLGNGTVDPGEREESDWITHVMPSLLFDYAIEERGDVKLGYQGDLAYYNDNDMNDWNTHAGFFRLNYKAPGGLILGIDNIYTDAEDPYGSENEFKLGIPQTERWSNDLKSKIGYEFSDKLRLMGYYNLYKQDYDEDVDYTQDYEFHEVGAGVQVRVSPKTWGFVRYHYGERDYYTHPAGLGVTESNDSDFDWQRANAGLTWDTTAKLRGEVNFGYQWKEYANETDVNVQEYDDENTWIASTFISFKATPATTLALRITRTLRERASDTNEYFEDTGIGINLKQVVLVKTTLFVGGAYSINDYNVPLNKTREDDNYKANIGVDYRIQDWLRAGIAYMYRKKDSNYTENEFTNNQFMVSFSALF